MLGEIICDRYRVEEELGAGAMGRVYRARHVKIGNCVAVKVMHRELAESSQVVARFHREANIAARLRHPNLVGVLDVGEHDGRNLMVLELAPGRRLSEFVTAPMSRDRVVDIARQLLRALHHAHAAGLIHRDLKPDNVLVEVGNEGWTARIVDFGIAVLGDRGSHARLTDANMIVGTPHYMSPEHATGREIDHRTDLFALGVIVYEMLCGKPPFTGTGAEVARLNVAQDAPPIENRAPFVVVDPLLEAFARKLMARRVSERFQSARDALDVLEMIERDRLAAAQTFLPKVTTRAARAPTLPENSDTLPTTGLEMPRRRRVWPVVAAAIVIAIAAGWSAPSADADDAPSVDLTGTMIETSLSVQSAAFLEALQVPPAPAAAAHAPKAARRAVKIAKPDITKRYIAVGKLLRGRSGEDPLWRRYRWIRLDEALANAQTCKTAHTILDDIERALQK